MAKLIDEIQLAWASIQITECSLGWSAVAILPSYPGRFKAGRNSPTNCEAILTSFRASAISPTEKLPAGLGFRVARVDDDQDGMTWLALTRSTDGNLELFLSMVSDVLNALAANINGDHFSESRIFLGRIRAWQEFMKKGANPLSAEQEVGLIGELIVLEQILNSGAPPEHTIHAWNGPLDGLRDFEFGYGAVEVKTTIASQGFTAKISSLEQLDDSSCKPIFLCAVKCLVTDNGVTLTEKIAALRASLKSNPITLSDFDDRTVAAGYIEEHFFQYHRKFSAREVLTFEVDENFPRLTRSNVMTGVLGAQYEINIESLRKHDIGLTLALKRLEMI